MSKKLIRVDWAMKKLTYEKLSKTDRSIYDKFQENIIIEKSVQYTAKQENTIEIARNMIKKGFDNETIAELTGLTPTQIDKLRAEN